MAPQSQASHELASEESWAWSSLDPEIRAALSNRINLELASRCIPGAIVYFIICVVLAFATPYYSDHPIVLGAVGVCMLLLGTLRIVGAKLLKIKAAQRTTVAKWTFFGATYATFVVWGAFCAWTLRLYPGQWTSMLLLLSAAALAGGTTSSLAPSLSLAWRCLALLMAPTIASAFTLSDSRQRGLGSLGVIYLFFLLTQARNNWRAFWGASVAAEREKIRGSEERRKAEQEKASLVAAIEQAAEEILITDVDGSIVYSNPSFQRNTGYSREEVLGQNPRLLKSGKHSKEFYQSLWSTIGNEGVWTGRLTNKRKDGTLYETEGTISPIHNSSGKMTGFVSARHDVTNLLHLEAQLRQAQKMESIGRLRVE